jgi:Ca2+-binding RTX toxin-like protein
MAVPTFHITNEESVSDPDNAFVEAGPATLLMDADAWFISPGSTIVLHTGSWTATINGKVTSSDFGGGGNVAIYLYATAIPHSITIGATAEITGYTAGIWAEAGADIINKGNIVGAGPSGFGIRHSVVGGDYKITNSGSISGGAYAIDLTYSASGIVGGIHTIINSGLLDGPTAIYSIDNLAVERITNSGQITGKIDLGGGNDSFTNTGGVLGDLYFGDGNDSFTNKGTVTGVVDLGGEADMGNDKFTNGGIIDGFVELGGGNDVFTNFAKVKVKGKLVQRDGEVAQSINLGGGNDTFNGGNKAEVVFDRYGADTYKLGGGNDTYFSMFYSPGIGLPDGGQDFVDGGAGRDYYSGDDGGVINLDNKAHDGFAANLASLLTDHSLDEHIFNFEDASGSGFEDRIYGTAGANYLNGNSGNDQIYGLAGNDILDGDFGNDHLYGGAGRDVMTGSDNNGPSGGTGEAADTFHFLSLSDSGVTRATRDLITDFVNATDPGFRDLIDLSAIDAITGTPANDDFTFIGLSKWHHVAGELRYVWTATQTFVEADVNGDAKVDFSIALDGHLTLTAADFVGLV